MGNPEATEIDWKTDSEETIIMYYVLRHGVCLNCLDGDTINQRVTKLNVRARLTRNQRENLTRARCAVIMQRASKSNARAITALSKGAIICFQKAYFHVQSAFLFSGQSQSLF